MTTEQASRWGALDDAAIAEARTLMNVPLRRDRMQWVQTATRDAVRQFAQGVGDDNPLWTDANYAAATRWSTLLAPPSFLYAVDATIVAPKLPGVQWIYAGTRWRWFDVIRIDDAFDVSASLVAMEEKSGRRFGRWVLQTGEIVYRRNDGGLLAIAEGRCARTPRQRGSAKPAGKPAARGDESLPATDATSATAPPPPAAHPPRRAGKPRLWESVTVGNTVGPDIRPLHLLDIYRWYVGAQGALHYGGAHADAVRYRHRHDDFEINETTGAKDSAARGHFSSAEGRNVGMGGAYDVGLHRISWFAAMLTDWMGDDGFLAELDVDVLRPNLVNDTTTLRGEVTRTWLGEHAFVGLNVEARNQNGVLTASGRALVALPSREHGPVVLPLFGGDPAGFANLNVV
jgi:acyl dehydratase